MMKIAIVGAGAIGGYLGVKLALAGNEVSFIARGANLEAIQKNGMRLIEDGKPDLHATQIKASTIKEAGQHDYVFLTMKSHQVAAVAEDIDALCHPDTSIVTLQNGLPWWYFYQLSGEYQGTQLQSVDPGGVLWNALKPERVIGSVVYPAAELVAPGIVKLIEGNRFTLGEPSGEKSGRVTALANAMINAGFKVPVSSDIRSELWVKLWGNMTFNPVSALTHATLQDICQFPLSREVAARMMAEAQAIGEKLGVQFKIPIDKRIAGAEGVGAHKTSMLQDVEQGKALELEAIVGSIVELAHITSASIPTTSTVYALVKLLEKTLLSQQGKLQIQALT
jgi:2-dehydropantoate 2-reductase